MFKLFISPDSTVLTGKPCTTQIINFRGVEIYFLGEGAVVINFKGVEIYFLGEGVVAIKPQTVLVCRPL